MVVGGIQDIKYLSLALVINIKTKKMVPKLNMNQERSHFGIAYDNLNKEVYCLGGCDTNGYLTHCEKFNTITDQWIEIAQKNKKKTNASVCILNTQFIFEIGGYYNCYLNEIEKYSIYGNSWETIEIAGDL